MKQLRISEELSSRSRTPAAITLITSVISLLFASSPTHVAGFVITVVVGKAIKRVKIRWAWSNISKKILKTIPPAFTDGDSSASVVRITLNIWVIAPVFHSAPSFIFARPSHGMGTISLRRAKSLGTATSVSLAAKMVLTDYLFFAAITPTEPSAMTGTDPVHFPYNDQSSKPLTRQIFKRFHIHSIQRNCQIVGTQG